MTLLAPAKDFWGKLGKVAGYFTGSELALCQKAYELMPDENGVHIPKLIEKYVSEGNPRALELKLKWPNTELSQKTIDQLKKLELIKKIESALVHNHIEEAKRLFEPAASFAKGEADVELLKKPFQNHFSKIINKEESLIYITHKLTSEEIKVHVRNNHSAFVVLIDAYDNLIKFYPKNGVYYFKLAQLIDFFNLNAIAELAEKFKLNNTTALYCYEMAIQFKRNHFFALAYRQCLSEYNKQNNPQKEPSEYLTSIPTHHIIEAQKQKLDYWMDNRFIVKADYSEADLL